VDFSLSAEQRELTEAAAAFARREPLQCAGLAVTGVVTSEVKVTVTGPARRPPFGSPEAVACTLR